MGVPQIAAEKGFAQSISTLSSREVQDIVGKLEGNYSPEMEKSCL